MQITHEELLEIARRYEGFKEMEEQFLPNQSEFVRDNFILECAVFQAEEEANHEPNAALVGFVYNAAKLMFNKHAGVPLWFDVQSAYSEFSSPWTEECQTPEEYVIRFARRFNETDEAQISDAGPTTLMRLRDTVTLLKGVGVPLGAIMDGAYEIAYVEYGDDEFPDVPSMLRVAVVIDEVAYYARVQ